MIYKPPQACEFVQHHQQPVAVVRFRAALLEFHLPGKLADNHVDDDPHQRTQPRLVGGLGDNVQRHRVGGVHQILDPKRRPRHVLRDHRIAVAALRCSS